MTSSGESAAEQAKRLRAKARRLEEAADKWERGAEGERQVGEILNRLPAEYVVLIMHFAQMPTDAVIRNLELFMSEIKPALDEVVTYEED